MVQGFECFKSWFSPYPDQYTIIGGVACDLLMADAGLDFRATKDIDMVLIIESLTPEFGFEFWNFVKAGAYLNKCRNDQTPQLYRFSKPTDRSFPEMIELFSRHDSTFQLPTEARLTPIIFDDAVSSLSALLLDDEYYKMLGQGRTLNAGVPILDAPHLILFKAKAWLDLTARRERGESIDSRHIKKHKNDIARLSDLLSEQKLIVSVPVYQDLMSFLTALNDEEIDLKQLGVSCGSMKDLRERITSVYIV